MKYKLTNHGVTFIEYILMIIVLFIVISGTLLHCSNKSTKLNEAQEFFQGNHALKEITFLPESNTSRTTPGIMAVFTWQSNKGHWINATIPINKIRFDDEGRYTCKFRWGGRYLFQEHVWWEEVIYVVLSVPDKDVEKYVRFLYN